MKWVQSIMEYSISCISMFQIMIWIKLMNWQKNWKRILGGYLSETNSIGYR